MLEQNDSGKRIAFVLNALTGKELTGGNRDVARVYALLTDPELGMCKHDGSKPIHECKGRNEFWQLFSPILECWNIKDQLVFYFSGHGTVRRGRYCLKLGPLPSDFLPFENLMTDLDANGVQSAILILDACHSGAAIGIKDSDNVFSSIKQIEIPKGIAIIASSRATETSRELPDGSSSVFTDILCKGIETGLDNQCTDDGLITVGDIVTYIRERLNSDERYKAFRQRPVFKIDEADRNVWISKNRSGAVSKQQQSPISSTYIRTLEELEFLYENTIHTLHPCVNAAIDELDWELIEKYSNKAQPGLFQKNNREKVLSTLGFYSPIFYEGSNVLHKSAVLCFHSHPESIYPQARAVFVVGNPRDPKFIRQDVTGHLNHQIEQLIALTNKYLEKVSYIGEDGRRNEKEEVDSNVVRELISNAITHRDYSLTGNVTVIITPDAFEVRNPGKFPPNVSWEALINFETPSVSCPVNAAISQYLSNLLVFEGIGRGFEIFKKYIQENGENSIVHKELPGSITYICVLRGCFKSFALFKMMLKKVESKKTNAKIFAPNGLVFLSYQGHKANHSRSGVPYAFHLPKRSTRLDPDGRLLSQPFQHQSDHNGIEHGFTGFDELFIILAQASRTPKPAKCPLNYPPSG